MATVVVDLSIGGRSYRLGVPAAEVKNLQALAARVDAILSDIKQAEPLIDRDQQLVMTCLQLMAELSSTQKQLDEQQSATTRFHRSLAERLEVLLP